MVAQQNSALAANQGRVPLASHLFQSASAFRLSGPLPETLLGEAQAQRELTLTCSKTVRDSTLGERDSVVDIRWTVALTVKALVTEDGVELSGLQLSVAQPVRAVTPIITERLTARSGSNTLIDPSATFSQNKAYTCDLPIGGLPVTVGIGSFNTFTRAPNRALVVFTEQDIRHSLEQAAQNPS